MLARVAASADYPGHMTEVSRSLERGEGRRKEGTWRALLL